MKTTYHPASSRGYADHGWLKSYHTFSFARYFNPERVHFGKLRVLNDDVISGGSGFGTHPHDNMEIVSIPIYGGLAHKDTMGNASVISTGEVQIMSAGSGLQHSEFNASQKDAANFLQIWVFPKERNIMPRYEQKVFSLDGRKNKFQTVVGPDRKDGALWINQDSWFTLADFEAGKKATYNLNLKGNGVYLFVMEGELKANGFKVNQRDGLGIEQTEKIDFEFSSNAKILLIEVPMV